MMDIRVRYLGLELSHPFMAGASPLADTLDGVRRLEDAGASAIVLRSLFEEQIENESMATWESMESHANMFAEATSFMADPVTFRIGPEQYLEHLRKAKEAVNVPVIGSLNGTTLGGWLTYARAMQDVGADAIELNVFDVPMNERVSAEDIEHETIEIVRELKGQLRIPLAVKLSPFYTSLAHFAKQLEAAGADGLVLFNRFFEPDIDIENLRLVGDMKLSNTRELLLRLRWLAILSGLLDHSTLAVTGGVHRSEDAVKAVMSGASVVQVVSLLLTRGVEALTLLQTEFIQWMLDHEYESISLMRGSMNLLRSPNPEEYARANYMRVLQTWEPS